MIPTLVLILWIFVDSAVCYSGNYALSFDGTDIVKIGMVSTDEGLLNKWTLEAWIKPSGMQNSFQPNIIGYPRRHPNLELCGSSSQCNGKPDAMLTQLREEDGSYFTITGDKERIQDGVWSHVAGSWDNTTLALYVNGKIDASMNPFKSGYENPLYCSNLDCEEGIEIGGYRCCGGYSNQYFRGIIDEIRVWNVGRSQAEIISTMNSTLSGAEPNLIYYWRFDEGKGSLVSSLARDGYGTLGGGILDAEPQWIPSDAPLTNSFPINVTPSPNCPNVNVENSYLGAIVGASLIAIVMLVIGIVVGLKVIPKFAPARSSGDIPLSRPEDKGFID